MQTHAQGRAFNRGTLAAMEREKEQKTTFVEIHHAPNVPSQSLLKGLMNWLAASGVVNMQTTRVVLGNTIPELQDALTHSQQSGERFKQLYEEAQKKLDALKNSAGQWVTLTVCAEIYDVDYSTMWRAQRDGRLKAVRIGGNKNNRWMCDPSTYVPAIRKLTKDQ